MGVVMVFDLSLFSFSFFVFLSSFLDIWWGKCLLPLWLEGNIQCFIITNSDTMNNRTKMRTNYIYQFIFISLILLVCSLIHLKTFSVPLPKDSIEREIIPVGCHHRNFSKLPERRCHSKWLASTYQWGFGRQKTALKVCDEGCVWFLHCIQILVAHFEISTAHLQMCENGWLIFVETILRKRKRERERENLQMYPTQEYKHQFWHYFWFLIALKRIFW